MGFLAVFPFDFPFHAETVDRLRGKLAGGGETVTDRMEEILGDDADPVLLDGAAGTAGPGPDDHHDDAGEDGDFAELLDGDEIGKAGRRDGRDDVEGAIAERGG